ncbi:MAG: hypothetical protein ABIF12_00580 [bacterium]
MVRKSILVKKDSSGGTSDIGEKNDEKSPGGGMGPQRDPKDNDDNFPRIGDSCHIVSGTSKASKTANPNSCYYKIDNNTKSEVVSKTVYNKNGQPEFRVDLDHSHFSDELGKYLNDGHKHVFEYNVDGKIIKPVKVLPLD